MKFDNKIKNFFNLFFRLIQYPPSKFPHSHALNEIEREVILTSLRTKQSIQSHIQRNIDIVKMEK